MKFCEGVSASPVMALLGRVSVIAPSLDGYMRIKLYGPVDVWSETEVPWIGYLN